MKKLTKLCIVCGKEFTKPVECSKAEWFGSSRRPLGRRFCSRSCAKKNKPSWNKGIPWTDEQRDLIRKVKKGKNYSPKTQFKKGHKSWNEGRAWTEEERKKISESSYWRGKTGEQSPNWKGGTTPLGIAIRSLNLNKKWRLECFKRDNYTCIYCGARSQKGKKIILHCDHINPFYKILKENKIRTIEQAKQCKELWDINNGRTLCILCHKQTPSYLVNQWTV